MVLKNLIVIVCLFSTFLVKGQTDDLMIVEYVDWSSGDGWAIKIYNPTNQSINLSLYNVAVYNNGNTSASGRETLFGTLSSKSSKIIGNENFNSCSGMTLFSGLSGVNDNDAIAITKGSGNNIVDIVGAYGVDVEIKVGSFPKGLYHHKIVRKSDNCIRYTNSPGSSTNAWPSNSNTSAQGWDVFGVSCLSTAPVNLSIPDLDLGQDTTLCDGDSAILSTNVAGSNTQYIWNGVTTNSTTFLVTDSGSYTLKIDKNFCSSEDEIIINFNNCDTIPPAPPIPPIAILIPNIITPNGDNINDEMVIMGLVSPYKLSIYNRWGRIVFETTDYKSDWNAENLPDGNYLYSIETNDFDKIKGWIQVLR